MKHSTRTLQEIESIFLQVMKVAVDLHKDNYVSGKLFDTICYNEFGFNILSSLKKRFSSDGVKEDGFNQLKRKHAFQLRRNKISTEEILEKYNRVFVTLGKQPTENDIQNIGGLKMDTIYRNFGTHLLALEAMYKKYNVLAKAVRPANIKVKKTERIGEDISKFQVGMNEAPTNEQGVVFVFSKIHDKIGFPSIENIQIDFPDCRASCNRDGSMRRTNIEFKFKTSLVFKMRDKPENYKKGCHYLICWEDDSPTKSKTLHNLGVEVISLKGELAMLYSD